MASDKTLVLVAAYQNDDLARKEFDALVARVAAKEVSTYGFILVAKDADPKVGAGG